MKTSRKTVGVYEAPPKAKWPRVVAVIFALLVGIAVWIAFGSRFFGEARADAMPRPEARRLLDDRVPWIHRYNASFSTSACAPRRPSPTSG
jgi:hypothetical protein